MLNNASKKTYICQQRESDTCEKWDNELEWLPSLQLMSNKPFDTITDYHR